MLTKIIHLLRLVLAAIAPTRLKCPISHGPLQTSKLPPFPSSTQVIIAREKHYMAIEIEGSLAHGAAGSEDTQICFQMC